MQIEAERNDALEEEAADAPLDETVAAAIEEARERLGADVQKQIANARYAAEKADELNDAVRAEEDERTASGEFDILDVDDRKPKPVRKPKPLRKSFVKRDGRFVAASGADLRLGEKLYRHRPRSFGVSARYIAFATVRQKEEPNNE